MLTSNKLHSYNTAGRRKYRWVTLRIIIMYLLYIFAMWCIIFPTRWVKGNNLLSDGQWALILLLALVLFVDFIILNTFHREA